MLCQRLDAANDEEARQDQGDLMHQVGAVHVTELATGPAVCQTLPVDHRRSAPLVPVECRLPAGVKQELVARAEREGLSLSGYLRRLLVRMTTTEAKA